MKLIVCGQVIRADSDNVFLRVVDNSVEGVKIYSPDFVFGEALEHLNKNNVVANFCVRNKKEDALKDYANNKEHFTKKEGILYSSSSEHHLDMDFFVTHSVAIGRYRFGDYLSDKIGKFFFLEISY